MMKKHQKARKFVLSAIASSLLAMPAFVSAERVNISQEPLLGVSKVIPSVVLALSVEYPTAGIAYSTTNVLTTDMIAEGKGTFLGYFDSGKCYEYVLTKADDSARDAQGLAVGGHKDGLHGNANNSSAYWYGTHSFGDGYFNPTSNAQTIGGYQGLCTGTHEWSGNALNFMTMSALDVVRQTLTGGNRAKGVGAGDSIYNTGKTVYDDGDPTDSFVAYLRRAMMWSGTESADVYPMVESGNEQIGYNVNKVRLFAKEIYSTQVNGKPLFDYLVPDGFSASMTAIRNACQSDVASYQDPFKVDTNKNSNCHDTSRLLLWNNATGFYATLYDSSHSYSLPVSGPAINGGSRVYQSAKGTAKLESGTSSQARWFNVVVKSDTKPTGLLQEKADMRTAVLGYLPEKRSGDNTAGDGGVLRAKMRRVMDSEVLTNGAFAPNPDNATEGNSGVLNYVNKFGDNAPYDSRDPVAELYYTAIRYLRNGAWKWVAEGTGEKGSNQSRNGSAGALPYSLPTTITDRHKDGFPVITKWDDPLRATGDKEEDMQCYAPAIIVLGDTNTHSDNNLPNYPTASGITDNVALYPDGKKPTNNTTSHYYEEVCKLSGFCNSTHPQAVANGFSGQSWRVSSGANGGSDDYAPTFGMAGMVYWVKTNNIRPDIVRDDGQPTYISSFFIDVLEDGMLKTTGNLWSKVGAWYDFRMQNTYYLAGKFASIDDPTKNTRDDFDSENGNTRPNWTNDPKGASSNDSFPLGMPKNYAVANNPENMRNALLQAFKTVGFAKNTMQSAIQYNNNGNATLNVSGTNGSASLVGTAIEKITNSDGSESYTIKDTAAVIDKAKNGEVPLALRAGYRFSQRTGYLIASVLLPGAKDSNGVMEGLVEVPVWEAGEILYGNYHNGNYVSRNVYSKTGVGITTGFTKLNPDSTELQNLVRGDVFEENTNYFNDRSKLTASAANAENLIKYILGDPSQEGKGLRTRSGSLLGTSVYSSVTPILKNTAHDFVRTVPLGAYNEKTCYYDANNLRSQDYAAMSSNEGMLHIFDMAGNEKFAYMPQTALPYIANFASPDYDLREHRFVNDGASLLHEVCKVTGDTGVAKTYLVGTSGRGASSIYAIDVTGDNFNPVLEINAKNDPDIGILVSGPLVVNDGNNTPVLIFSSGYNPKSNIDKGYLFFYNLETGVEIAKVELGTSGVGAPFGYDTDGDGVADRIYVGDHAGNIWRVNRNGNTWSGATGEKLFDCTGNDCQPITGRPVVGRVPNGKVVVLAGTGEYFHFDEMLSNAQNYAYGIFDDDGTASVSSNDADLLVQRFGTEQKVSKVDTDLTYMSITQNALEDNHKGWKLELPQGYVISSDSEFYGPKNQVAVYTATKVDDVGNRSCNVSGDTLFIAVDAQNGGAYSQSLFDVDNDGRFTGSDFVGGASAGAVHIKGRLMPFLTIATGDGQTGSYVRGDDGQDNPGGSVLGGKQVPIAPWLSSGTLRRVSWREIF